MNSMCPGWVRTRMGGQDATLSVEEVRKKEKKSNWFNAKIKGAATPIFLCLLPHDGPSGKFFGEKTEIPW